MKKLTTLFMAVLLLQSLSIFAQDAAPLPEENPLATEPAAAIVDGEEEDEEKGFELTGFVDAYYQAGLTESSEAEEPIAFPTSFTDQTNQFAIGMVNLMATKEMGKVSFVGQVGFGPRAVAANSDSNDDGSFGDNFASTIQQLYVSYSPSDAVTFTLGNFGTFVGYEVIDAPANVNYSTSYLFSNGPFYHTGAKVDFAISDGFGAMIGVFNDTDSKIDAIDGKHIGGQLSFETGGLAAYLNVLAGKEAEGDRPDETDDDLNEFQIDLTATYEVSESVGLGLNVSNYSTSLDGVGQGGFFGTALYGTFGFSETAALGLRAELFNLTLPEDATGDTPSILSLTASGNFTVGDLRIIPELRFDTGSNGIIFGDTVDDDSIIAFILAGVYSF